MMKKGIFFVFFVGLISSCAINKKPVFVKVDNIKIINSNVDKITLGADAFFKNPNDVGGKIATDSINVFVNNIKVAQVSSNEFKVPARKEFVIPLVVEISTKIFFGNNKNGILSGLLNSVLNKSIKIQFKGNLRYKVLGFSKTYPINKTDAIKIKL